MLQQNEPDDYVVATGETHSIREFLDIAFQYVRLNWQDYVEFDKRYLRPAKVNLLIDDSMKAKQKLGWQPSVDFEGLVHLMVEAGLRAPGLVPLKGHVVQTANDVGTAFYGIAV